VKTGRSEDLLGSTENLLREGLRRLGASAELPGAHRPLREALELTEKQTLATISAAERGQSVIAELRRGNVAQELACDLLEGIFRQIVASQQGQDLAGQRLQQALGLLRTVDERIRRLLQDAGVDLAMRTSGTGDETAPMGQEDVDAILRDLGI